MAISASNIQVREQAASGGGWVRHEIFLPGGRGRIVASEVRSVSPVVCWDSLWAPVKVPVGRAVTPWRLAVREEPCWELVGDRKLTTKSRYNTQFLRSPSMAIAWSAPTYSSQRQEGGGQRDVRQVKYLIFICAFFTTKKKIPKKVY